ncbi:ABC transporter ATP-binding protein [Thermotoga sp. Ku-13t]|uniref:ABC transporter ATP-binding protein n=1 Tax=Thermotoga sp. Ku-13t TaxID=1755813 RepID=UPI0013ECEC90|nr:ABC transporter ATP-binding protein [Thermotoga sp. Ku-13t]
MAELLRVEDLTVKFFTSDGIVHAVDGVSFSVGTEEVLGMVGESGCGKSVTSLAIMRLLPVPPARIVSGKVFFDGKNLRELSETEMRKIRGNAISMIFQEPMTSLNPVITVGKQIAEAITAHQNVSLEEAKKKAIQLLRLVGIPNPEKRYNDYPHQMSGGMRQRAMIAMALACNPRLLIADEPTTALDVTVQAQILDLIAQLKKTFGMSVLLITHDLGVIAEMCDRVIVMYAGQIVEEAPCVDLFESPLHPYTEGLLRSIPKLEPGKKPLYTIEGNVPNAMDLPAGCRFHPRCVYAFNLCREKVPALINVNEHRRVRCFLRGSVPEEVKA